MALTLQEFTVNREINMYTVNSHPRKTIIKRLTSRAMQQLSSGKILHYAIMVWDNI